MEKHETEHDNPNELITVEEAAEWTRECKHTWYRRIKAGFPHFRGSNRIRLWKSDVVVYLRENTMGSEYRRKVPSGDDRPN